VFDGTDPVAFIFEYRNQFFNQRGFTGLRPSDNANNLRHIDLPAYKDSPFRTKMACSSKSGLAKCIVISSIYRNNSIFSTIFLMNRME
jgi:hypothetical protein